MVDRLVIGVGSELRKGWRGVTVEEILAAEKIVCFLESMAPVFNENTPK